MNRGEAFDLIQCIVAGLDDSRRALKRIGACHRQSYPDWPMQHEKVASATAETGWCSIVKIVVERKDGRQQKTQKKTG